MHAGPAVKVETVKLGERYYLDGGSKAGVHNLAARKAPHPNTKPHTPTANTLERTGIPVDRLAVAPQPGGEGRLRRFRRSDAPITVRVSGAGVPGAASPAISAAPWSGASRA